ncbi:hypothetical protein C7H83_06380 [Tetragenococcus halophilus]|nr:hypothetical protein C7H83_06380 [Tetragenococcus halophilus]NWO00549.1 hypothetical protein [Tetragenococcus halophilus]GBD64460.1 hypothetical protein TEHD23766T_1887 [Tetragenococcus halophilus subsp. flandriensis]
MHQLLTALIVMFIPSIVISILIIKYVDLRNLKKSSFGIYVQGFMTKPIEAIRFLGFTIMIIGAWCHLIWMILVGLIIIVFGWLRGIVITK